MKPRAKPLSSRRRLFLIGAATGTAGVAAALAAGGTKPMGKASAATPGASRGYHVTEHINNYIRTTKI